jgi:hypothetical protein
MKQVLEHRFLPMILAAAAFIIMLPAVKSGLMMDDLLQRPAQLKPDRIPSRLYDTSLVPRNYGKLSTVLFDLFGFNRKKENLKLAKDYGTLPWWVSSNLKGSLWRPLTAFTHWLDYRLFPNSPVLMHIHNIMWFAAIVFLTALVYRSLIGPGWVAGFAALLFLLDKDTYFPTMFVANRGFIVSLFFGLACLYMFHKWRSTKSLFAAILSHLFLVMSLLSNEAGVSTFAFLLAYVLIFEQTSLFRRILSLLPFIFTIVLWRIIYDLLGYGVSEMGGYIDPGNEPLRFINQLSERALILLGSQISGLPPDTLFLLNDSLRTAIFIFYVVFFVVALIVFLPLLKKDKTARFWFAAFIFAVVPASTVTPTGKNLGFAAVGAFGLIAIFIAGLFTKASWMPKSSFYRVPAWSMCVILIFAHILSAIAGRIIASSMGPFAYNTLGHIIDIPPSPNISNQNVIVINTPCQLLLSYTPFYRAYYGESIPKTFRTLALGGEGLEVTRTDERTLVVKCASSNIFSNDQNSPLHFANLFGVLNSLFIGDQSYEKGEKQILKNLMVEILAVDSHRLPSEIAFRFETSLDDPAFYWLWFDWTSFSYKQFRLPQIGQTVSIPGPPPVTFRDALHFVKAGQT